MNIEYDHIRDIFMQKENKELWEKFKGYYNLKRYHNYMFTITRISDVFKREYVERIAAEFRRSNDLGELDMSLFTKLEQEKLSFMMKQPGDYYLKYCLYGENVSKQIQSYEKKLKKAEKRVKILESSTTFKVGKMIMFVPIALKKAIKKVLKH